MLVYYKTTLYRHKNNPKNVSSLENLCCVGSQAIDKMLLD